ncbi:MAG: hypothetical protein L3J76_02185, partial [Candidatus Hydrothermae bacterium]|nr:hypothetical protein [Candidatus Hydrothermae bacterium]
MKQNRWIWILGILILGMGVQTCGRKKGPAQQKVERVVPVRVGIFRPGERVPVKTLHAGEVGYLVAAIREIRHARVGDTVVDA